MTTSRRYTILVISQKIGCENIGIITIPIPTLRPIQHNPLIIDTLNPRPAHILHISYTPQRARDRKRCHAALIGLVWHGCVAEIEHGVNSQIRGISDLDLQCSIKDIVI